MTGLGPPAVDGALSRPCPRCGAGPGARCRVLRGAKYPGQRKAKPHEERTKEAK